MVPRVLIDTAKVPGGEGELRLMKRGADFLISLWGNELMNSRLSGSEKALATLACERLRGRHNIRMLIGGLGMGFTLRAALAELPKDARITVVELVPEVVQWARGPMAELFGDCLDDPRVTIVERDVGEVIDETPGQWDAILMDVDNGPDGVVRKSNDRLYARSGLDMARRAVAPGGVLAYWSAASDPAFARRLAGNKGWHTDEIVSRANGAKGARHVIWVTTKL
ncbi:spermidine synthase [Sphingomonas crocodyli]|uniref:Spermidine synthase n=1 Tax=Sphingomonas crocodyli TaxID=1979270 RepID=A0A437LVR8_9SPHN|nr:hypothetical protein [Sphingomonas crocodyli]RVT89472.1 hypothetical protein EOD43_22180 [Sphingomonas crocodyli]